MNALFGGMSKNRDISEIITALRETTICNEAAGATSSESIELRNAADAISKIGRAHV